MQQGVSLQNLTDSLTSSDSISGGNGNSLIQQYESFIVESKVKNFEISLKEKSNLDWVTFLMLASLIFVAISNFLYRKRFLSLLKAFIGRNYSNQLIREANIFKEQLGIVLFIIFIIAMPLFYAFSLINFFPIFESKLNYFLLIKITGIILLIWTYQILLVKTTALLFKTFKPSIEILTQIFIFNVISALVVIPFTILFHYSGLSIFLILGIAFWGFIQLYRMVRLLAVGLSYSIFSRFHLFLYLCTLEIIPLVVLSKILNILSVNVIN